MAFEHKSLCPPAPLPPGAQSMELQPLPEGEKRGPLWALLSGLFGHVINDPGFEHLHR